MSTTAHQMRSIRAGLPGELIPAVTHPRRSLPRSPAKRRGQLEGDGGPKPQRGPPCIRAVLEGPNKSLKGRLLRAAIGLTIGICVGAVAGPERALAQDRSPTMGETHPADVVLARRVLMAGVGRNMDEITGMLEQAGPFDLNEAREHADLISTMLLAFPHLFPVETNTWSKTLAEDDPAHVSLALPAVWENYGDFTARAQRASQTALDASFASTAEQFKALAEDLQQACNSCHQKYRRP